jgi:urocanate hydratase
MSHDALIRQVDAGYKEAVDCAHERGISAPGLNY